MDRLQCTALRLSGRASDCDNLFTMRRAAALIALEADGLSFVEHGHGERCKFRATAKATLPPICVRQRTDCSRRGAEAAKRFGKDFLPGATRSYRRAIGIAGSAVRTTRSFQ